MLVPVREAGSLLPQMIVGGVIRRHALRKWFWVVRSVLQGIAVLASTVLSMPFYVILAHRATGGEIASRGILMVAGSLATALSGITWRRLSDSSDRLTLVAAGLSAGSIGGLTAGLGGLDLLKSGALWLYGGLLDEFAFGGRPLRQSWGRIGGRGNGG